MSKLNTDKIWFEEYGEITEAEWKAHQSIIDERLKDLTPDMYRIYAEGMWTIPTSITEGHRIRQEWEARFTKAFDNAGLAATVVADLWKERADISIESFERAAQQQLDSIMAGREKEYRHLTHDIKYFFKP